MIKKILTASIIASLYLMPFNVNAAEQKTGMTMQQYIYQADQGSPYAAFRTGLAYEYGVPGISRDVVKAIYYYKIADKNGNIKASAKLGGLYLEQGYPKDALPYLMKAVQKGDSLGQAYLGKLLEDKKEKVNAIKLYELSSKGKNPVGQFLYADYLIRSSKKGDADYLKGYALLALSAQKNDDAKNKLTQSRDVFTNEQKVLIAKYIRDYK